MMPALLISTSTPPNAVSAESNMRGHGGDIRDVGLSSHGPAAGALDPGDHRRRGSAVAGIVHHHGEAVLRQPLSDRGTDAAGGAR